MIKKIVLPLFLLIFFLINIPEADAQALRVSSTANQVFGTSATSGTLTGVQVGDLITVVLRERDGMTPSSISDSVNGQWNLSNVINNNGVHGNSSIYYLPNSSSGNIQITVTYSGVTSFSFYADAWSGLASSDVLGQTSSSNNTSQNSHPHGTITTSGAGIILTGSARDGTDTGSITASSGFTLSNNLDRNIRQYKISTGSETTSASFLTQNSANTSNVIAYFRSISAPVPPAPSPTPSPTPTPTPTPTPPPPTPTPTPTPPSAGARTLYVDVNTGNDSTSYANNSISNPWRSIGRATWGSTNRLSPNSAEAAKAGDTVIVNAGTYSTTGAWAGTGNPGGAARWDLTYYTINSGTQGNPITIQANGVVNLTYSSGSGPMIGASQYTPGNYRRNYITWRGFTINEANAPSVSDTGPAIATEATGIVFENNIIIGVPNNPRLDNYNGIRIERADDVIVRNNRISNFYGAWGRNMSGIMSYYSSNVLIENNEITGARNLSNNYSGTGIFLKADCPTLGNFIIRNNKISDHEFAGILIHNHCASQASPTKIYQNIITNSRDGIFILAFNYSSVDARNIKIYNNTIVGSQDDGILFYRNIMPDAYHVFKNNIISGGSVGINYYKETVDAGLSKNRLDSEHNVVYNTNTFAIEGVTSYTPSTWRSTFNQDAASPQSITSNPLFISSTDFRLQPSSPARVIGVDYLDLDGDGSTSDIIPAGAYITGNEVIGINTGGVSPSPTPTPPPPTPTPTPLAGDLNVDHVINSLDWSIMNSQWFTSNSQSDLRVDGQVNSLDFAILSSNWGRTW